MRRRRRFGKAAHRGGQLQGRFCPCAGGGGAAWPMRFMRVRARRRGEAAGVFVFACPARRRSRSACGSVAVLRGRPAPKRIRPVRPWRRRVERRGGCVRARPHRLASIGARRRRARRRTATGAAGGLPPSALRFCSCLRRCSERGFAPALPARIASTGSLQIRLLRRQLRPARFDGDGCNDCGNGASLIAGRFRPRLDASPSGGFFFALAARTLGLRFDRADACRHRPARCNPRAA